MNTANEILITEQPASSVRRWLIVSCRKGIRYADWMTSPPAILQPCLPKSTFVRGDVNDRPKLWTLLQEIDCVYHLAAKVLVPESVLYPREYNEVNVGGTVT